VFDDAEFDGKVNGEFRVKVKGGGMTVIVR